jgi:acetylornithine deacetylase/succinyl-diaminopimelate desuccinylase family protein
MDDHQKARLLADIDANFDVETAFLAHLVRVPSDNPPGDTVAHAASAARLLESIGFTVERHVVPTGEVTATGMISVTNLIVRQRFGDGTGPVIALNAHGDVVPPGEGWTTDPYGAEIRDGVMYGRGVAVSKSDFATYAFALLALRSADGFKGNGTVELHLTYDEETGGEVGPAWLLAQGLSKPDYAISAGFTHNVVIAHNGCLHLQVTVLGRSAHAARPDTGVDALEAATSLLRTLYDLRETYAKTHSTVPGIGSPSLVIGLIEGGINTNVVPDQVTFRLDRRIIPEENPDQVEHDLVAAINQAAAQLKTGIEVTIKRILLAAPMTEAPGQDHLVAIIRTHARAIIHEDIPAEGTPIYCDARHYSAAGIPTVLYGAGPRNLLEANGHRADERLVLADLRAATKVVALSLVDLLR